MDQGEVDSKPKSANIRHAKSVSVHAIQLGCSKAVSDTDDWARHLISKVVDHD